MKCLKCGREQETEQVFCQNCLLEMEKYPVNPNATVHLPLRKESSSRKLQPRRHILSPEVQIRILKKRLWLLTGILVVILALLLAMVYPTVNYFTRHYHLRPGQNYNTVTTVETTNPTEGFAE